MDIPALESDRDLVSVNLAIRIEMVTDESIALLDAIDSQDASILRQKAISFKSMFFALYFRTHYLFVEVGKQEKKVRDGVATIDEYAAMIQAHPERLDALELMRTWRTFCDLLNVSGVTNLLKPSGPRHFTRGIE